MYRADLGFHPETDSRIGHDPDVDYYGREEHPGGELDALHDRDLDRPPDWPDGDTTARDREAAERIDHGNLDDLVFGEGAELLEPGAEGEPLGELQPVDALPGHWKPFPPEGTEDILILHRQDLHDKNIKPRRAHFDSGAWLYEDGAGQPFSIKANGGLLWCPAPPGEPPSPNHDSTRDAIERAQAAMARIRAVIGRLNPRTATDGEDALAQLAAYRLRRDAEVLEAAEGVAADPS